MAYIIGQAFGLLTIACSLVMPFLKRKWQLLCANMAINLLTILNLSLIGQFGSANFLCLVAIVQSAIALPRAEKRGEPGRTETALFTVLYVGFGFFGIFSAPGFVPELNYRNLLELLPIMGACFVASAVSVILQVGSYKLRNGKRIFKMAPLHHHFELKGFSETKIVSGYMIVTTMLCLICLLAFQ